jgi:colanic acid/amylovoran biosynthesis protein
MKHFLLYGHGGAYNHGAEAIIKCTADLLNQRYPGCRITLSTHFKDQDLEFNMPADEYCERDQGNSYQTTLDKITGDTICLSVGGDNYCYDNWRKWKVIHETALERGAVSILWSCSVEPSMLSNEMADVLKSHHLITARESLTLEALKSKGINNVIPCTEIAFLLKSKECGLPDNFIRGNTVAVNISPLVVRREELEGIILRNTESLIRWIIENTDMNVALIPHVMMPSDNDFTLLKELFDRIGVRSGCRGRVCLISENLSAAEYKYIISQCRFGVFARTHASTSAYSTGIPSVVIGYSVKSRGIAKDIGLEDYVLPVENFLNEDSLLIMFKDMLDKERGIRQLLSEKMPLYIKNAEIDPLQALEAVKNGNYSFK